MINIKQLFLGLSIPICITLGFNISALAKESTSNLHTLETITVTADKREKNIQDVAGSVSALGEMQIEDAGIYSEKHALN